MAITLHDDPTARPALLLVVGEDTILGGDIVTHPSADVREVAVTLARSVRAICAASGTRPRTVEVRHESVAAPLAELLADTGIAVRAAECMDAVDRAIAGFDQEVVGRSPDLGPRPRLGHADTWAGWRLPTAQIARFFAACATFYRAAPWTHVVNEDVFRTKVKGGGAWSASVMGYAGEVFGLALYARHEDLEALLDSDPDVPAEAAGRIHGAMLSVTFGDRNELSRRAQKEVARAQWEVTAPSAYPVLIVMNTPGGGITERQMDDLIALVKAVASFTKKHETVLSGTAPARFPLRWRDSASGVSIVFEPAFG